MMKAREHSDFVIRADYVEKRVGEATEDSHSHRTVDLRERRREAKDSGDHRVDRPHELGAQAGSLRLVPVPGFANVETRGRSEAEPHLRQSPWSSSRRSVSQGITSSGFSR